jgi:serine/threonine protein kinase
MATLTSHGNVQPGITVPNRLAAVLSAFEAHWQQGERPRIEEVLQATRPDDRTTILAHLIRIEVRQRVRLGETPSLEEYSSRFPQDRNTLLLLDWTALSGPLDAGDEAAASTLLAPPSKRTTIGRFELIDRVGVGGFGEVWRAYDPQLQRDVAIKIGHTRGDDETQLRLMLHEARSAGRLKHAGIVTVHETGVDGETAYIVTDFIAGTTLAERIKGGPLPHREAAEIAQKIALAVAHAHERGIIHRDIKPANVLLDQSAEPHLTDFGVARRTAGDKTISHVGQALGTPAYMAPEQARGETHAVDHRADIHGIGLLLYEMLAGCRAYPGDAREAMQRVMLGPPQRLRLFRKDVPRDLETIVEVATAAEPSDRYASAAELAADLERYLNGEPIVARKRNLVERALRTVKRRPLLAAAPCIAALSAMAFAAFQPDLPPPGTRLVSITTVPPGAEMAFVPLDPRTGEPQGEKLVRPGKSPVEVPLAPGEYLVVAALDDGRFHEVQRHVPSSSEAIPYAATHRSWRIDNLGRIFLPPVSIPPLTVTDTMVLVTSPPESTDEIASLHPTQRDFYIDPLEFTVADYRRVKNDQVPNDRRYVAKPDDHAVTVDFDTALALAESVGKRLPTDSEYEQAATSHGTRRFPWGDHWPLASEGDGGALGPVGMTSYDRTDSDPPVLGLCSNVAEWTQTWADFENSVLPGAVYRKVDTATPDQYRVVRGGNAEVLEGTSLGPAGSHPRHRLYVWRHELKPGLGFRGVRSTRPRLTPEDFGVANPANAQ